MNKILSSALAAGIAVGGLGCGNDAPSKHGDEATGSIEVSLTKAPNDAGCLRITVAGTRSQTKLFDLTPGADATFGFSKLPVGIANVTGEAFAAACAALGPTSQPVYVSEAPVSVRIDAIDIVKVVLKLIRNGKLNVGVDFEDGPSPYVVGVAPGVVTKDLLTVGDSVGGYKLTGLADGTGAFDNGDGTFTWLVNHEIAAGLGAVRAHGAKGAFVSKWTLRKSDLTVLAGEDLIKQAVLWDPATSSFKAPATGSAFGRFCAAELAPVSAFHDAVSGAGFSGRLFLNGEEVGNEGRAFAHGTDGISWELPRLGKFSWENAVAHPGLGAKTGVIGLDDSTPGQVYYYLGTKTSSGSAIDKAGLSNGTLYGIAVAGFPSEITATGIPSGTPFTLVDLGNVENKTGATLEADSTAAGVTRFNRPEDGAWDPSKPSDFYFVSTASFTTPSRLWRLRFADPANPAAGGTIDMVLDGSEGHKMLDNLVMTKKGLIYLQEDPGNQAYNAKVWRYDVATKQLTVVAQHDPLRFLSGAPLFLTQDEESSGIIDASEILGPGWFLLADQAHYAHPDPALVEGGQLLALYDPAAL